MSSPISGLTYDTFKPELWSAELNYSLKKNHVGLGVVNRNWEGDIRAFGDTVHIIEPGSVTSRAYTAYSDVTFEQPSESENQLVIDQADYFAVDVDDIDEAQSRVPLITAHMQEASYSLADTADAYIFTSYTAAGSGIGSDHANPVSLTGINIYSKFVDAAKVLDLQSVPKQNRWAAISPNEVALLRTAAQFVPVENATSEQSRAGGGTDASARIVATGEVGAVAGFTVYETNNLTTISGVRKALFGTPRAITFANQIAAMEALRREARFADAVKGLHVYGKKEVRTEALACLHITP